MSSGWTTLAEKMLDAHVDFVEVAAKMDGVLDSGWAMP